MGDYDELSDCYYEDHEFDCGWSGDSGQLCDDAGSESCSFFCPHYRTMIESLGPKPKPPRWAQDWGQPNWINDSPLTDEYPDVDGSIDVEEDFDS